jgi:hypothetical protein
VVQRSAHADRVLDLAREEADWFGHRYLGPEHRALGIGVIGPELLLLGVVTDIQTPWPRCMNNRWRRQLHASVGLPKGYRGAAGPLLDTFGVDPEALGSALVAELRAGVR